MVLYKYRKIYTDQVDVTSYYRIGVSPDIHLHTTGKRQYTSLSYIGMAPRDMTSTCGSTICRLISLCLLTRSFLFCLTPRSLGSIVKPVRAPDEVQKSQAPHNQVKYCNLSSELIFSQLYSKKSLIFNYSEHTFVPSPQTSRLISGAMI